jgi:K+-transporting ATPase ATPase C chain
MKNVLITLKIFVLLTIITGIIYPAFITLAAQVIFNRQANGDPLLIGQKFDQDKYFWSRPSAVDHNTLPSGGSNLSVTSRALKTAVTERKAVILAAHQGQTGERIPSDLLYASGSGLDPHISTAAALFQAGRVAKARGLEQGQVLGLIARATEPRDWSIFGERRVNVLKLNRLLDGLKEEHHDRDL